MVNVNNNYIDILKEVNKIIDLELNNNKLNEKLN